MDAYHYSAEERQALLPWLSAPVPTPPSPLRRSPVESTPEGAILRVRERVRGMLLGLAIGDSLGNTTEGMTPGRRARVFGEVRDYLPNRREEMRSVGLPSDDTQLAFWTLESLLGRGHLDPVDLAEAFTRQDRIFGIGATVTSFLFAYRFGGKRWFEAGQPSAGNGALMRIAPVVLPHLRTMTGELWRDVVAATVLTHMDEAAVAAGVGFVGLLVECLAWTGEGVPEAGWWPETFLRYARTVETNAIYGSAYSGDAFRGSLCDRVAQLDPAAVPRGTGGPQVAERPRSGAYLLETVPCVLHILAGHGDDPEEAIVRAVNDTADNDTIAALVGAAMGALHGESALPEQWRRGLLGRTREQDDGHVQSLVERAIETFVS